MASNRLSMVWVSATAAGAAVLLALITASQTYLSMLSHGHSFLRILTWQLACWGFWAAVAPWIVRISSPPRVLRLLALGLTLSMAQAAVAAQMTVWLHPFSPVALYSFNQALGNSWPLLVMVNPLAYGLVVVGGTAFAAFERARQLELRESQLEGELTRSQLDALRLEIQPHFLFNTLNSIAALIRLNDSAGALSMLVRLGEMMRTTLDQPAGQLTPLDHELGVVKRYIDLHRTRFGDRLEVVYRIDESCGDCDVPTFLLQPLVENALRHGLASQLRPGRLEIGARRSSEGGLRLWVADDGAGLREGFDERRHAGTGLTNTRSRMARLYGAAAALTIRPDSRGGTIVEVALPPAPRALAASGAA